MKGLMAWRVCILGSNLITHLLTWMSHLRNLAPAKAKHEISGRCFQLIKKLGSTSTKPCSEHLHDLIFLKASPKYRKCNITAIHNTISSKEKHSLYCKIFEKS